MTCGGQLLDKGSAERDPEKKGCQQFSIGLALGQLKVLAAGSVFAFVWKDVNGGGSRNPGMRFMKKLMLVPFREVE